MNYAWEMEHCSNGQGYLLFNLKFEFVFYGNCLADCCHFVDSIHNNERLFCIDANLSVVFYIMNKEREFGVGMFSVCVLCNRIFKCQALFADRC